MPDSSAFESVLLVKVAFPYNCYRAKTDIGTTMNKMDTLACCIALLGCNGNAIAFTGEEAKAHVIAQEKAWSDAVIHHDIAKVASILADDFIGIDGRGFVTDKAAELKEAEPPAADSTAPLLLKEDLSDFTARIYGNTAVLNLTIPLTFRRKERKRPSSIGGQRFGCATRTAGTASPFTAAAFSSRQRTDTFFLLCLTRPRRQHLALRSPQ